jgi:hypothetical protein
VGCEEGKGLAIGQRERVLHERGKLGLRRGSEAVEPIKLSEFWER